MERVEVVIAMQRLNKHVSYIDTTVKETISMRSMLRLYNEDNQQFQNG
jgi:hypothetical protein